MLCCPSSFCFPLLQMEFYFTCVIYALLGENPPLAYAQMYHRACHFYQSSVHTWVSCTCAKTATREVQNFSCLYACKITAHAHTGQWALPEPEGLPKIYDFNIIEESYKECSNCDQQGTGCSPAISLFTYFVFAWFDYDRIWLAQSILYIHYDYYDNYLIVWLQPFTYS